MTLSRRTLLTASGALGAVALTGALPARMALAAAPTDQRFVLVILRGALDGLAAVPPIGDADYRTVRGQLALDAPGTSAEATLPLDGFFALHPALAPLKPWYEQGELAIFHAVASPYRDRSHFDAQNLLDNGTGIAHGAADGWLNRALPFIGVESGGRGMALAIGTSAPLVLHGTVPVATWAPTGLRPADDALVGLVGGLYAGNPEFTEMLRQGVADRALLRTDAVPGGGSGPAKLAATAGALLATAEGPRIAVLELSGWDTHANQGATTGKLAGELGKLAEALVALKTALGAAWTRTVVTVVTEFGRTAAINGSGGTDHGTATVAFVAGPSVRGGRVATSWPGLASGKLYQGRDLAPTADVRSVLRTVLQGHFGMNSGPLDAIVFPGGVPPVPVFL